MKTKIALTYSFYLPLPNFMMHTVVRPVAFPSRQTNTVGWYSICIDINSSSR